ncbi:hypothetical protein Hdeb2414_s0033g00724461 [Helianthus debilis subsp. tardiflorus]
MAGANGVPNGVWYRLEIEWATVGNTVDCRVFTMRHMETWFRETDLKWDNGFSAYV